MLSAERGWGGGLGRMAALGGHETPLAESLREINPSASFVRICQNLSEFRAAGAFPNAEC